MKMLRRCTACNIRKEENEFYASAKTKYKNTGTCRICRRKTRDKWRKENREIYLKKSKEYRNRTREHRIQYNIEYRKNNKENIDKYNTLENVKLRKLKASKKYASSNPVVKKAHSLVNHAIERGEIQRLPCQICSDKQSEAHHWSYKEEHWLSVIWLCSEHHRGFNGIHKKPELYEHLIPKED